MSDLNSWEDDPAAQDDNLSRQTQRMNLNNNNNNSNPANAQTFRPGAASFQPTAHNFMPGQQAYSGGQNFYGYQQPYSQNYYPQYDPTRGYNQQPYGQGYGNIYGQQGGYNNQGGYGKAQNFLLIPPSGPTMANSLVGQQQYPQHQQQPQQAQQPAPQAVPTIAKRPEQAAAAAPSNLNKPVTTKEGGPKVLSIGGDTSKPKAAKVISIGVPAAPKDEPKEELKEATKPKEDAATEKQASVAAGAKVTATKAIEKTGENTKTASGKTSPTPSSGRSSPSRGAKAATRDADAVVIEQAADVDDETLKEIYGKEHVNVIFLGHVDAGKSTLGGSILYATGMVDERTSKFTRRRLLPIRRFFGARAPSLARVIFSSSAYHLYTPAYRLNEKC